MNEEIFLQAAAEAGGEALLSALSPGRKLIVYPDRLGPRCRHNNGFDMPSRWR